MPNENLGKALRLIVNMGKVIDIVRLDEKA